MSRVQDIVYGWFSMPERVWDERLTRIRWISLRGYDMDTVTDIIIESIRDQSQAKNILICAYQRWAGIVEKSKLLKCFNKIIEEVEKQEKNKVVFSSTMFLPNSSSVWKQVGILNDEIRWCNERLKMPPVSLHKMGMTTISEYDKTLRIRGCSYVEFQAGFGFGRNPSYEGCVKIKNYLLNAFDNTFSPRAYQGRSRYVRVKIPPPLIETEGYRYNAYFRQELEDRNLAGRPASTGGARRHHLTWSERRPEGWHRWDLYKNNPCPTKEERERAMNDWIEQLSRTDERPVWGRKEQEPAAGFEEQAGPAVVDEEQPDHAAAAEEEEIDLIVFSDDEQEPDHDVQDDAEVEKVAQDLAISDIREQLTITIENEEETDCNDIEVIDLSDDDDPSDDHRRYNEINEELVKEYRKELANKNVQISKQKTATKQWRGLAYRTEEQNQALVKDNDYYKRRVKVLEKQVKRIEEQYNYLKGMYEQGARRSKINDRRFAKPEDFLVKKK
jgi:hypothetical protein